MEDQEHEHLRWNREHLDDWDADRYGDEMALPLAPPSVNTEYRRIRGIQRRFMAQGMTAAEAGEAQRRYDRLAGRAT